MSERVLDAEVAARCLEVLREQERVLRYDEFGAREALVLGSVAAGLAPEYAEGYVVTITREADEEVCFQWLADGKGARNLMFAAGKRAAALRSGHASPWRQLEAVAAGQSLDEVWAEAPQVVCSCGAFPIRIGNDWVATIAVSGLHEGLDHEVILRSLEQVLGRVVPRFEAPVA